MTTIRNVLVRALPLLLLTQSACDRAATSSAPNIENTTICAISRSPLSFDGRRVSVNGCITTDGYEYVILSDRDHCASGALVPIESTKLPLAQQYSAKVKIDQRVCGIFTGTFRLKTAVYHRVLEVESTSNLKSSLVKVKATGKETKSRGPSDRRCSA